MVDELHPHPALPLGEANRWQLPDRPDAAIPELAQAGGSATDQVVDMNTRSRARRRYIAECATTAGLAVAWLGCLVFEVGGERTAAALSNFGLIAAAGAAGIACFRTARFSSDRQTRMWKLLGASALSWGCGQTAWTWYENVLGREVPFPSLADVGYLAAPPLAAAALLSLPFAAQSLAGRVRQVLDGLMIAASLLLASWVLVLRPVFRAGADNVVSLAISLAYPIGDVVVGTIVLFVLARARMGSGAARIPLGLLGAGLVAWAVADSGFAYLTATESYASGALIDAGWFLGYLLVMLAARKPEADPVDEEEAHTSVDSMGMFLPYIAVVGALAVSTMVQVQQGILDYFASWTRSFIIIALVGRQVLSLLENLSLARHLEQRVVERTAELRASEQRFQALVQHSSEVVILVDRDGQVEYVSESMSRVFGYSEAYLLGRPLSNILDASAGARLREGLGDLAERPYGVLELELPLRHRDGRQCTVQFTITNLLDNPSVGGLVLNTRDISERRQLEDQLVHQAFHDSLTSLANRALFKDRVEHALQRTKRQTPSVAVLFLDLDGFKEVNDSLGHEAGDRLLIQVAERLHSCVRPSDTVARFGGDEFAVLIEDASDEIDVTQVADRVLEGLRQPFLVSGRELHVRGSMGIARMDSDVEGADQLLRNADLAMYRAKAAGRGGYERYDPEMHTELVARVQLESDLRRALEAGELYLHYQPTFDLASGQVVGAEALARWKHPIRGQVPPTEFIPLAEASGLIRPLGAWVLREACRQAAEWQRARPQRDKPLTLNINLSGRQLQFPEVVDDVARALRESGLPPESLVLEMTESVLMDDSENVLAILRRLKELGARLAIDDFGTGYSSLSYLHRFPVDMLKIDRSFVERLSHATDNAELARTIVRLGQSLQLVTVAEGVEDSTQFLALRRMGCDVGQGYYFGKPMDADEIGRLIGDDLPAADRKPATTG
jgi:diguanylate cyclase (GGDEF)-like protein/PAS domain S-box-containing protein